MRPLLHQLPAVAVLVLLGIGLVLTRPGNWQAGLYVIGGAVLLAGLLRAVLPTLRVGVLAVRGRWFDTATFAVFGTAIVVLTALVPKG